MNLTDNADTLGFLRRKVNSFGLKPRILLQDVDEPADLVEITLDGYRYRQYPEIFLVVKIADLGFTQVNPGFFGCGQEFS